MFAVLTVAIPVLVFEVLIFALYALLRHAVRPVPSVARWSGSVVLLAVAVASVALGASLGVALIIIACSPTVIIVGYETVGWRHGNEMLEETLAE